MSLFILDTDVLTLFQEGHVEIGQRIASTKPTELATTVLSVEEQLTGWYTAIRKAKDIEKLAFAYRRLTNNLRFLSALHVLTFDVPSIQRYDNLRKLKLNVRKMDLRIAAVTLENNGILVTRNARDFKQVPNLRIEDWAQ